MITSKRRAKRGEGISETNCTADKSGSVASPRPLRRRLQRSLVQNNQYRANKGKLTINFPHSFGLTQHLTIFNTTRSRLFRR